MYSNVLYISIYIHVDTCALHVARCNLSSSLLQCVIVYLYNVSTYNTAADIIFHYNRCTVCLYTYVVISRIELTRDMNKIAVLHFVGILIYIVYLKYLYVGIHPKRIIAY
jgi:hypothetical protein